MATSCFSAWAFMGNVGLIWVAVWIVVGKEGRSTRINPKAAAEISTASLMQRF
jgi:hypothetical protein